MDEYSIFAPVYDLVLDPFLKHVQERIVSLAHERGVQRCVDLCCGTGALACRLGQSGVSCIGLDLSEEMLGQAEEKHCPGVRFFLRDAADSGLQAETFDLATICFALHEKPESLRLSILNEALRVLVPGGLLVVVDYSGPGRGAWPFRAMAATVERVAGHVHYRNFRNYMNRGGLEALLRQCNIKPDRTELFHGGVTSMTTAKKTATA